MFPDVNLTKCYLKILSEVRVKKATFWYMTSRKQIGEVVDALIFEAQVKKEPFYAAVGSRNVPKTLVTIYKTVPQPI